MITPDLVNPAHHLTRNQIAHSEKGLWLQHLQGARDLILFRGGPRRDDFLTRFFSLLDVSGSLWAGQGPLLPGNYWLEDAPVSPSSPGSSITSPINSSPLASSPIEPRSPAREGALQWPYYDPQGIMTNSFHTFMIFMAKVAKLSGRSMHEKSPEAIAQIRAEVFEIKHELQYWWASCAQELRDLPIDWRRQPRQVNLSVADTLEYEAFSSTRACMQGCLLFVHHIINPIHQEPPDPEISVALKDVLDIAAETPEGYGLEMGLYYGLFAAGASVHNNYITEDTIRKKLKADTRIALYVRPKRHIRTKQID